MRAFETAGHFINQKTADFKKFDFRKIREHLDFLRDQKKEMSKEQKNVLKEQRALVTREFGYCIVDGRLEKVRTSDNLHHITARLGCL